MPTEVWLSLLYPVGGLLVGMFGGWAYAHAKRRHRAESSVENPHERVVRAWTNAK